MLTLAASCSNAEFWRSQKDVADVDQQENQFSSRGKLTRNSVFTEDEIKVQQVPVHL